MSTNLLWTINGTKQIIINIEQVEEPRNNAIKVMGQWDTAKLELIRI